MTMFVQGGKTAFNGKVLYLFPTRTIPDRPVVRKTAVLWVLVIPLVLIQAPVALAADSVAEVMVSRMVHLAPGDKRTFKNTGSAGGIS